MTPATSTAVKPTTMETLAPKIRRDSTSRPSWSVPNRNCRLPPSSQAGGRNRSARFPTSGLCGAITSANTASRVMAISKAAGMTGKSLSRARDSRGGPAVVRVVELIGSFLQPDARIDDGVDNVHHEVDDD